MFIWDAKIYGIENGYSAILKQAQALAQQQAEPSLSLLRFADTAYRHSDLENLEPAVMEFLQHLEARIISSKTAAFRVSLADHKPHGQSLLHILMIEAIKHGLVLCDEVAELVILPDGSIWSIDLQLIAHLKSSSKFPVTTKRFHQLIQRDVGNLLIKHGFLAGGQESLPGDEFEVRYDKAISMGKLSLFIGFDRKMESFEPSLDFRIIEDHMIAIAQKSDFKYPMTLGGGVPLNVFPILKLRGDEFRIDGWGKFEELLCLLRESVLRWSDAVRDIKDIDALLNGDMDEAVKSNVYSYLYTPYALIAARLAGNPNFEELALNLGTYGPDSGRTWGMFGYSAAVAWPKLVNYLREEIKPLADWPNDFTLPSQCQKNELPSSIEDTNGFPITRVQFHELFNMKIEALLFEHGFILIEKSGVASYFSVEYEKNICKGKFFLEISCEEKNGFIPAVNFSLIEDNMIAIAQKSDFQYSMRLGGGIVLNLNGVLQLKEQHCINNHKTFEEFVVLLKQSILKWSDAVKDIKSIDALINGDIDEAVKNEVHSSRYSPFALIAARLAGNPNFDELAVSLGTYGAGSGRAWGKFSDAEVAVAWPKLVKYLREEVKPLI